MTKASFMDRLVHRIWPERTEEILAEVDEAKRMEETADTLLQRALDLLMKSSADSGRLTAMNERNHFRESIEVTVMQAVQNRKEQQA